MLNDDLIAFLQPCPSRWAPQGWRDVCDRVNDIRVAGPAFSFRAVLPKGYYRCRIETRPGAFDMDSARIEMVQAPDGKRVLVGPWDLNHIDNVMAMPMARTTVNSRLKGGLWFEMPGPEKIAEGRLGADFGFEVDEDGETTVTLELVENAADRLNWMDIRSMELRTDNRPPLELRPASAAHPRIFVNATELDALRQRLPGQPAFEHILARLRAAEDLINIQDISSILDISALLALITREPALIAKVRAAIVDLCSKPTWSGRPDPLLMGGDNDRNVGFKLYFVGLAWEYLRDDFTAEERTIVSTKAEEYLRKMYDFTILQRAYMGHPTTEPHSLGAWIGAAVAAMAFYDDLPIARKALPFFHGLYVSSLTLFSAGGKAAWATFFPKFMTRYIAAAHTFGGTRPELSESAFLDHLGEALLSCYETPNGQEMQRGLRTVEHRELVSFLCRFHPTPGAENIYQAFYDREMGAMGNVEATVFDLLYAPAPTTAAAFPKQPLFVRDIGEIICASQGATRMAVNFGAGLKGGGASSFSMMPHNRCFGITLGAFEVQVDGSPVLMNLFGYGLKNALDNAMCFGENGGGVVEGQYLLGEIGPEKSPSIRRCLITDRFVYAHALVTEAVQPQLGVRCAERIFIMDYRTGALVLLDAFHGEKALRYGTHLHCAGSVTDLGGGQYRLTGGQARTIAAPRRSATGAAGLTDDEKGELFVTILGAEMPHRVVVAEPTWCPSYIYGINNTGKERIEDAVFPRFNRWRLEATEEVDAGMFLLGIGVERDMLRNEDGVICLPQGAIHLAGGAPVTALGVTVCAEAVLVDEATQQLSCIGLTALDGAGLTLTAVVPVDLDLSLADVPTGTLYSPAQDPGLATNLPLGDWAHTPYHPRSRGDWSVTVAG